MASTTSCGKLFPKSVHTPLSSRSLQKFNVLPKPSNENQDPMCRLFAREGTVGGKLLGQVRKDLADVIKVCGGELKQTNHLRSLMSCLTKGVS